MTFVCNNKISHYRKQIVQLNEISLPTTIATQHCSYFLYILFPTIVLIVLNKLTF